MLSIVFLINRAYVLGAYILVYLQQKSTSTCVPIRRLLRCTFSSNHNVIIKDCVAFVLFINVVIWRKSIIHVLLEVVLIFYFLNLTSFYHQSIKCACHDNDRFFLLLLVFYKFLDESRIEGNKLKSYNTFENEFLSSIFLH